MLPQNQTNRKEAPCSIINVEGIEIVDRDGTYWFSAEQIGKALGYANGGDDVNRLYRKNVLELQDFSVTAKLAGTDGKLYECRLFSEEGLSIITMLARTSKAVEFRRVVARLLKRQRAERLRDAVEEARRKAVEAAMSLTPFLRKHYDETRRYLSMGLNTYEIARLRGINERSVRRLIGAMRLMGTLPDLGAAKSRRALLDHALFVGDPAPVAARQMN